MFGIIERPQENSVVVRAFKSITLANRYFQTMAVHFMKTKSGVVEPPVPMTQSEFGYWQMPEHLTK